VVFVENNLCSGPTGRPNSECWLTASVLRTGKQVTKAVAKQTCHLQMCSRKFYGCRQWKQNAGCKNSACPHPYNPKAAKRQAIIGSRPGAPAASPAQVRHGVTIRPGCSLRQCCVAHQNIPIQSHHHCLLVLRPA
jgi:hypothetical protein